LTPKIVPAPLREVQNRQGKTGLGARKNNFYRQSMDVLGSVKVTIIMEMAVVGKKLFSNSLIIWLFLSRDQALMLLHPRQEKLPGVR